MNGVVRTTILGCGSSGGVPRVGGDWGACDPQDPRNRRTRCSVLLQRWPGEIPGRPEAATTVLIDTSPDLRAQCLSADVRRLDAIVYSHIHADQTHGIDDVRALIYAMRRRIPAYLDPATAADLIPRFAYIFEGVRGYPALLDAKVTLAAFAPLTIEGPGGPLTLLPLPQDHGEMLSYGFRYGAAAYCNDVVEMPEDTLNALGGLDVWVADALRYDPHPTHAHVDKTLGWREHLAPPPRRTILTNLHVDLDFSELAGRLPAGVEPAVDGLMFETRA